MKIVKFELTNVQHEALKDQASMAFSWESKKIFNDEIKSLYQEAGLLDSKNVFDLDNAPANVGIGYMLKAIFSMERSLGAYRGEFDDFGEDNGETKKFSVVIANEEMAQHLMFTLSIIARKQTTLKVLPDDPAQVAAAKIVTKAVSESYPELPINLLWWGEDKGA